MSKDTLVILFAAGLLALAGAGVSWGPAIANAAGDEASGDQQRAEISFTRQPSDGRTVVVDRVRLPRGGFVAIHGEGIEPPESDLVGSVRGASGYLAPGVHENVTITLSEPVEGTGPARVTAQAYRDTNGNEVFDFVTSNGSVDEAYARADRRVADPATLDLSAQPLPPEATLSFANQSARESVVVTDVTLSDGGFVTVSGEEGEIIGVSEYLPSEKVERVRIALVERPEEPANLTARAHLDTNDDRVFGFQMSDGQVDWPYEAGDTNVTARVRVRRSTETTTSPYSPTATETPTPGFAVTGS